MELLLLEGPVLIIKSFPPYDSFLYLRLLFELLSGRSSTTSFSGNIACLDLFPPKVLLGLNPFASTGGLRLCSFFDYSFLFRKKAFPASLTESFLSVFGESPFWYPRPST